MIKCILPSFKKYSFVESLFTRNLIYTHRYNHTDTNIDTITQIQSHRHNHTDTITQIQSHRYNHTDTITQIQSYRHNHTDTNNDTITQTQRYKNTHITFMLIRLYICFVRDEKFANKRLA